MSRRPVVLTLSAAGWLWFNAVMAWNVAFLAGVLVPVTVDGPVRLDPLPAVAVDLALFAVFALQHSVMARAPAKAWLARRVPAELSRTAYVLATNLCLTLLMAAWQPWGAQVWTVHGAGAVALWLLFAGGWVLAVGSTFAVDHLELFGLRQAGWAPARGQEGDEELRVDGLHALVRHPLMTGMLVAFWATPRMSASHLVFALAATGYILLGVRYEERDLRRMFGTAYDAYAARVPALVPGLRRARYRPASSSSTYAGRETRRPAQVNGTTVASSSQSTRVQPPVAWWTRPTAKGPSAAKR